jgi:membrane-associated protease RseP (regulator of RpoE activity)
VSSNLPEFPPASLSWNAGVVCPDELLQEAGPAAREWLLSAFLLAVTVVSTSFAGLYYVGGADFLIAFHAFVRKPYLILMGLPFSIPLISILLAHELGHFLACRYYGMRCTPPYFIPIPISLAGTFGAFIKIKSQFRHRRALFDIGIAGPLAGFLFTLPTLWIGISLSRLIPKGRFGPGELLFGEPLIFRFLGGIILGYSPDKQDMIAHPMAMAAWVGLLATSLNLLPIWQLDGGHIAYAVFGSSLQKRISIVAAIGLVLVSFLGWPPSITLLLFAALLLAIGARMRFYHPPVLMEEETLGRGRLCLGMIALLILIVSFTPDPVTITY